MRTVIILTVVLVMGLGVVGCRPKDAHEIYTERMSRLSMSADYRSMIDDIHTNLLMDDRPSHLSMFIQE